GDPAADRRGRASGADPRRPRALLQGVPRQGSPRARQGQEGARQAGDHPRTRHGARSGAGAEVPMIARIGLLAATAALALPLGAQHPRRDGQPRKRTVIVDAGHGGVDPGMHAMTSGRRLVYEKEITLQVAEKVAARLQAAGVNVVMTRTTDTLIALGDRGKI